MGRIARVVAVGIPHHVTQRGNNRAAVFFDDDDRHYYRQTLVKYCAEFKLEVWAYCLMTNHVHILAVPQRLYSLAMAVGRTNLIYTQYINRKYPRSGRLWQNRFFSCPIDREPYLWSVARYIETNPVRARIVRKPWNYPWSSARHHVDGAPDPVCSEPAWLARNERGEYRKYLTESSDFETSLIRRATSSGRPLGDLRFAGMLEKKLHRALIPKPAGRPRKRRRK